jgi:acyl carrier protein
MCTTDYKAIERKVIRIISKTKAIKPARLQLQARLFHDFGFDTLDVVEIILELEKNFYIRISDETPFHTVGDFVDCVTASEKGPRVTE